MLFSKFFHASTDLASTSPRGKSISDEPTDSAKGDRFYYGWVMFPIATLGLIASSPGQTFSISAFNESMRQSLGLSHSALTGAYMLGTFLAALPMGYIGAMADRVGMRRAMTWVVGLFGLVCVLVSQVSGGLTLFLGFLMLRMLGAGALALLSGNTLAYWFDRRLGTLDGLRHAGLAGAIAVVPAGNLWLIGVVGWRWSWVVLGLAVWAVMLPLMLVFRNGPADVGQRIDGGDLPTPEERAAERVSLTFPQAMRTRPFWIVCGLAAAWSMLNTAVLFNIVPLFLERGLTEADAARVFVGYAVSLGVMQFVGGMLADRLPLNMLLSAAATGLAASMWLFMGIESVAWVLPLSVTMGFSQGLMVSAAGPLWPRYYGTDHLGHIRGTLATMMVGASSVGPFALGLCVDMTGSYDLALLVFAVIPMPLIVLALFATPPHRPRLDEMHGEHAGGPDSPPEGML